MQDLDVTREELKYMQSRLYELCLKLFGHEFNDYYTKPKIEFSEWLNVKTGLSENYILMPKKAVLNWYKKLELMHRESKRS